MSLNVTKCHPQDDSVAQSTPALGAWRGGQGRTTQDTGLREAHRIALGMTGSGGRAGPQEWFGTE